MKTYAKNTEDRKAIVNRIAELTGEKLKYTMPGYTYKGQGFTVLKDGTLEAEEDADQAVISTLIEEGLILGADEPATKPQEAETEEGGLTVSLPTTGHTGATLRNLVNLVFTRASLLNKSLGTSFRVDEGLTDALQSDSAAATAETFLKALADYEAENGKAMDGLAITAETITFGPMPDEEDPAKVQTFMKLCSLMNKQAKEQNRIQAKAVNDENEKYALRIWLLRLGMNGPEFKDERRVLMANLSGHCAFRTEAEKERWQKRQAEKRDALKAAKAAVQSEEVASDEISE